MTVRPRSLVGLVVAACAATAGLVGLTSVPASAALCSGAGVNVVVDFHGLGGGVQKSCDPSGSGKSGDQVFPAAGFGLTYAQREPGFVCRVSGKSAEDPCVNASPDNAYWGLYWSSGKSGTWTYATTGVSGLSVPEGGFVAFSWQNGGTADPPGVTPVNKQSTPSPKPTKAPPKASGGGGGGGSTPATTAAKPTKAAATTRATATPTPTPSASARAAAKAKTSASARPSASASASSSASSSASPPTADDDTVAATQKASGEFTPEEQGSGLPVWVPIAVILGLGGAAGGAAWWRRRTASA